MWSLEIGNIRYRAKQEKKTMYKTFLHFIKNVLLSFTSLIALCYRLILGMYLLIQLYSCSKHMVQSEMCLAVSDQFHILTLSCREYMDPRMNGNTNFFFSVKKFLFRELRISKLT